MEYRPLGRTSQRVSAICLGTMTWGQQNTEAEAHAQMDYALEHGVDFFDTAELYPVPRRRETQGRTEEYIGSWFAGRPGAREKIVLASKVVGRTDADWFRDGGVPAELTRPQITEALHKSLKRLRTDHIDLYQVHWPDRAVSRFGSNPTIFKPAEGPENPILETLETLGDLVKEGKIRHIGVSNESAWGVMAYLHLAQMHALPRIASVQNAYSLVNRTFEIGLGEVAMRENVGLLAYSTLAQGYLTGKYAGGALPPGARKTLFDQLQRYEKPGADAAYAKYLAIAREYGLDPAQMAIRFAASRPFTTSAIIGATSLDQLARDIAAFDVSLPDEALEAIDAVHLLHQNPCP